MTFYASWVGYSIQMIIEGIFTTILVSFLQRVKPELLTEQGLTQKPGF